MVHYPSSLSPGSHAPTPHPQHGITPMVSSQTALNGREVARAHEICVGLVGSVMVGQTCRRPEGAGGGGGGAIEAE